MKKYKLTFITFLSSCALMLMIYAFLGVIPFGSNTPMIWDMEWQYSSFLAWFRNVLLAKADWQYSLIGGFGGNTMGLISYYLSSPLNLILLFFDLSILPWGILCLTLLKTGLMAASMQAYLYRKRPHYYSLLFGCFYAFSSYVICYQSNIMWLDSLILLPFVASGIEELVNHRRGKAYAFSLGLCIITNYYIGYMICIFSVLYFLAYMVIMKHRVFKVMDYLKGLLYFTAHSALAGGLSAFLILPTIYNLGLSSNKHILELSRLFDISPIFSYKHSLQYIMAGTFSTAQGITGNMPLIYCGIFPVVLLLLFFISKEIELKLKLFYGSLLFLLFFSFNIQGLYLIWHGCYSPVGSPWRFAFLLSFVLLSAAYLALPHLKITRASLPSVGVWAGILLLFLSYMAVKYGYRKVVLFNLCFVILLSACYLGLNLVQKRYLCFLLFSLSALFTGLELTYNALKIHEIQFTDRYEQLPAYEDKTESVSELLETVRKENKDGIFRTEILGESLRSQNDGYLYNINSLTMYSSSEKQAAWDLFTDLGWGRPVWNSVYDDNVTALSRNLAGVRYIVHSNTDQPYYRELARKEDALLLENENALPLGFLVKESAASLEAPGKGELFSYQNRLYQALLNSPSEDIYTPTEDAGDAPGLENRILRVSGNIYTDGLQTYAENTGLLQETLSELKEYTLSLEAPRDSKIRADFLNPSSRSVYACFTIPYERAWKAEVDGRQVETTSGMGGFLLVPLPPGQHTVALHYRVPYLAAGWVISILALIALISPKSVIGRFYGRMSGSKVLFKPFYRR